MERPKYSVSPVRLVLESLLAQIPPEYTLTELDERAETPAEEDEAAHSYVRLDDDEGREASIATVWGSERLSKIGEITDVAVTVPMERNELDYTNISAEDYCD
eukprot:6473325-Amphidinium_carterae.3